MSNQSSHVARTAVIDERVARAVAAITVTIAAGVLLTGWWVVLLPLAADFVVRASGRPGWSPLARFARSQVRRRLRGPQRPVAARPKQFAAGIGAVFSGMAAVAALAFGATGFAIVVLVFLLAAALLEAAFALCVGCRLYALLAAAGVVTDDCPECSDISVRPRPVARH